MLLKMKVLLVSPRGNNINGGIGKWTDHIMSYYEEHNDGVDVRQMYNSQLKTNFETNNIFKRLYNGIWNYYPLIKSCKRCLRKENFDVVHICTSASLSLVKDLIIARAARKKGVKIFVHCHLGRIPEVLKSTSLEKKLFDRLINTVDGIIVMDKRSFNALTEYGCGKVYYLPNPLSSSVEKLIEYNSNIQRIPRKIVFAGHVIPTKGVFELVEACQQIENVDVTLLGHIPDESIKEKLYEKGGNRVKEWLHIVGARPFDEVIEEMLSCNVFALPTYTEGFPNVIIESMACGCPIVTTPVGAIPEMLDIDSSEPCGICVEPKNVSQLREAIHKMIIDNDMACSYGARSRARVRERYSVKKVWEQLVSIWNAN